MYDPKIGQFISEDPIGFNGDPSNLYRYVKNNPLSFTDPDGLRAVTLEINYDFTELSVTPAVIKEVNRIFQDMMTKYSGKDKNGKMCHTLTIKWKQVTKKQYDALDFGLSGGGAFGGNPTLATAGLRDNLKIGVPGQSGAGSFEANINPARYQDASVGVGKGPDLSLATIIAHELGLHGIGNTSFHSEKGDSGFIDSEKGRIGSVFSKATGELLARRLRVDKC